MVDLRQLTVAGVLAAGAGVALAAAVLLPLLELNSAKSVADVLVFRVEQHPGRQDLAVIGARAQARAYDRHRTARPPGPPSATSTPSPRRTSLSGARRRRRRRRTPGRPRRCRPGHVASAARLG
jgi:hypothetical protein